MIGEELSKEQNIYYLTENGSCYWGLCEDILNAKVGRSLEGKVNLILTSPPFPLKRKKKYGNLTGEQYKLWLCELANIFRRLLTEDGSIVIEMGNCWEKGQPEFSTLPIESLLEFKRAGNFHLCQEFIHYNPARLPTPIEWVNKKRIRVKDSFTRIWWLSNTTDPKANNKNILVEYSKSMNKLLKNNKYNTGARPSQHNIGEVSFLNNNGGAIPSNVIISSNTNSNDEYILYCKSNGIEMHPARMPKEIPELFIKFLTNENDIVLDPFAGSNMTGAVAERLSRKWIAIEAEEIYIKGSMGRFNEIKDKNV